jgi:hypothetical protein
MSFIDTNLSNQMMKHKLVLHWGFGSHPKPSVLVDEQLEVLPSEPIVKALDYEMVITGARDIYHVS